MKYKPLCDCIYVDQSKIIVSKKKLYTSNVGTCSILCFSYNNLNFMAHIDALQNNSNQIINKIITNFDYLKINNVVIYKGPWCYNNCMSTNIILKCLKKLNISYRLYEKKIKWTNNIYINNNIINII
tara:strand:+ start:105 stop:485 length:381 start_codon:yes stop_codon:yes gene_type:complete